MLVLRWVALLAAVLCISIAVVSGVAAALPDGGQLAFVSNGELFLLHPNSTRIINLTAQTSNSFWPIIRWSPNGKHILLNNLNESDLIVLDLETFSWTKLTNTPSYFEPAYAWSPDGQQVAYVQASGSVPGCYIYRISKEDLEPNLVATFPDTCIQELVWSPDGRAIGLIGEVSGAVKFWSINVQDQHIHELDLTNGPEWLIRTWQVASSDLWLSENEPLNQVTRSWVFFNVPGVTWSSDGSRILFPALFPGYSQLFVLDVDCLPNCEDESVPVPTTRMYDSRGALSFDGERVAFGCPRHDLQGAICVINVDDTDFQYGFTWTAPLVFDTIAWRPPR